MAVAPEVRVTVQPIDVKAMADAFRAAGAEFTRVGQQAQKAIAAFVAIMADPEVKRGLARAREIRRALAPVRDAVRDTRYLSSQVRFDAALVPMESRLYVRARLNAALGLWEEPQVEREITAMLHRRLVMDLSDEDVVRLQEVIWHGYVEGLLERAGVRL